MIEAFIVVKTWKSSDWKKLLSSAGKGEKMLGAEQQQETLFY